MASVFPLANYYTKHVAIADNTLDTIYTCGDQGELAFDVTGLSVTATTANADTCSLYHTVGGTDFCLVFKGPVEADYPLQIEGLPIHMVPGDIIKAQATAGGTHTLHVHISGQKTTRSPKAGTS
jgi:hypothetical protein